MKVLRRLKQIFWNRKSNRDAYAEGQAEVVGGGAVDAKVNILT